MEGDISAQVGEAIFRHNPGDVIAVKVGEKHRLFSEKGGKIAEISLGKFEEDDIIRYQDDYGRMEIIK